MWVINPKNETHNIATALRIETKHLNGYSDGVTISAGNTSIQGLAVAASWASSYTELYWVFAKEGEDYQSVRSRAFVVIDKIRLGLHTGANLIDLRDAPSFA